MRGVLSLSIAVVGLGVAGHAAAQSRTVSTADMPRPGVSYIAGPSVPVRKETTSTGSLPEPSRFHVIGPPPAPAQPAVPDEPVDPGYSDGYVGGYYGGYIPAYGRDGDRWHGGYDHGHDHGRPDHGHDHDHDHDHDHGPGRPPQGTTNAVQLKEGTRFGPPAGNMRMGVAPPPLSGTTMEVAGMGVGGMPGLLRRWVVVVLRGVESERVEWTMSLNPA